MNKKSLRRNGYVILYMLFTAISFIAVSHVGETSSVFGVLLITSTVAAVVFNCLNKGYIFQSHSLIFKDFWCWLYISILTALIWVLSYAAVILSTPRFSLSIDFISGAMTAAAVSKRYMTFSVFFIMLIISCFIFNEFKITAFVLAMLSGIFFYIYSEVSLSFLNKNNLSVLQFMSIRFYMLIIICVLAGCYQMLFPYSGVFILDLEVRKIVFLFFLGIIGMIFPCFIFQKSLQAIGACSTNILCSFTLVLVFTIQTVIYDDFEYPLFIYFIILTLFFCMDNYLEYKKR